MNQFGNFPLTGWSDQAVGQKCFKSFQSSQCVNRTGSVWFVKDIPYQSALLMLVLESLMAVVLLF
jgi:hypothetical protein